MESGKASYTLEMKINTIKSLLSFTNAVLKFLNVLAVEYQFVINHSPIKSMHVNAIKGIAMQCEYL